MGPSFFKIMIGDSFNTKLRIPPAFRKEIEGMSSDKIILKTSHHPGKPSWQVNMVKVKKNYFFEKGWMEFAKDHCLETGDFLVFILLDDSKFKVIVYNKTGCPKKFNLAEDIYNGEKSTKPHFSVENIVSAVRSPCVKMVSESEEEVVEIAPSVKMEPVRSARVKMEQGHPHFTVILKKYNKYLLNVPKGFATETGILMKKKVMLKDPEGRAWPVIINQGGKVEFRIGWSAFLKGNKIGQGDKCVFQFIGCNVINVHVFRKGCGYGRGAAN